MRQASRPLLVVLSAASTLLLCPGALAQEAPGAPIPTLHRYRSMELTAKISFWHGLELRRGDGTPITLGYFGGGADQLFVDSPAALASMRTYRRLRIAGTAVRAIGLATMATGIGLVAGTELSLGDPLSLALLITSGVLSVGATVLMQAADTQLSDAIRHHNQQLVDRETQRDRSSSRFSFSYRTTF